MGNIDKAVKLTDYFVALPPTGNMIAAIVILGLLAGILINAGKYDGLELIAKGAFQGALVLAVPALFSAFAIKVLIWRIPFKRIVATTLLGEIGYAITYSAGTFISSFNPLYAKFVFLIGAALVFILWYAIARLVFVLKWRSFVFAIIQLMFHLVFLLFFSSIMDFGKEPIGTIARFYVASFVFLIAIYVFFLIINAPMRRNLGFSSTDALSMFVMQWLYQDKDLEEAFESVGETAKVPISVLSFERKGGKVFFVVPSVHYGPFGNLGGSEFSYMIADEVKKKYNASAFVFHSAVTHDLNPISSRELAPLMDAFDDCVKGAKYSAASVSFLHGASEECFSDTLRFDYGRTSAAFVSVSRAPDVTEDINFGVGSLLSSEAEKKVSVAAVADQHNAETGEVTSFEPGSVVGYNYLESVRKALAADGAKKPLRLGISERTLASTSVGNAGLKVAVLSTQPMTAIILIDANGVTPEFRERIMGEAKKAGKKKGVELYPVVFTTDTHQTNSVRGVLNPLKEEESVVAAVADGVNDAIADMSEAKFFAAKKWFEVRVLGAKQSIEIVSTVNSIVAVAKIAAPLILIGSIAALIAIISIFF